jgi:diguanylate cyclase (GGDEF)-like protein/PAS domain S-box-containing protein
MVIIMFLGIIDYILLVFFVLFFVVLVQYKLNQFVMEKLRLPLFKLEKQFTIIFYILTLFILVLGWWQINYSQNKENEEYKVISKRFAKIFSSELLELKHHHLNFYTSEKNKDYIKILNEMTKWQKEIPEIVSVYTLKKHSDGKNYFVVAPETDYDRNGVTNGKNEQIVPIGTFYEEHIPELEQAFRGNFSIQKTPASDQWGESISAFAPVFDDSGNVDAVIGIDYDASKYLEDIKRERLKGFGFTLLMFFVVLILYILFLYVKVQRLQFQKHKEELEISQSRFKHLSEVTMEGIVIHSEGKILEANMAACKMFGYELEEIIGMPIDCLVAPESWEQLERNLGEEGIYEMLARKKDGTTFPAEILRKKYNYYSNIANVTAVRDITERKKNEEKIYHMAFHDDLTDLPNRNFIHQILANQIEEASIRQTQLAVMFIEINGLKIVNDFYGYTVGDQLMLQVIAQMKKVMNDNGILGRWGGNEFILIMPDAANHQQIKAFAEQLIEVFENPIIINDQEFFINARVGISLYPRDGVETKLLIKKADIARYQLDEKSTSQFLFFDDQMDEVIYEKLNLERELRKALDSEEFELYYQPQIQLGTGKIIGMEALIRWNHPSKGMIPPNKFIPVAEETRLVIPINEWVIKTACRQMKELLQEYPHLSVSVNLSPYEFESKGFVYKLAKILKETNLPSHCLDLEITERMTMDIEKAISILNELKSLGVTISMDDFGTGYSSLSYLNRLPIDRLKIDQTFIRTIKEEEEAILSAIISLGHNIGVKVLAEGVETEEQISYLKQKNCDEVQGYYYAKPLPFNELKKFLEKYHFAQKVSSGI